MSAEATVATPRAEYTDALPDLDTMADVLSGTRGMHAASAKYITRWERESSDIYDKRRVCETFFEGCKATLSAGVGLLFGKPLQVAWNGSESLKPVWDNLDNAGTAGPVLVKRFADMALRDGLAIALTDHPSAPVGTVVTAANEAQLGLRPTVALYARRQAINWFSEVVANRQTLTFLVLQEGGTRRSGFAIERVTRYRVLELAAVALEDGSTTRQAKWTLLEEVKEENGKVTYKQVGAGVYRNRAGAIADFLPVAVAYAGRTDAPLCSDLPLLGVAWANIAHWRKSTDIEWYERLCAFPQRIVKGELLADGNGNKPTELPSGPGHAIQVSENGDVKWDELAGTSLVELKKTRDEKLAQMGAMGMGFMAPDERVQETAEAKRLDSVAEQSTLATAGQSVQDATNLVMQHVAWFAGVALDVAPTVTLHLTFTTQQMQAALLQAWGQVCANNGLPVRTLIEAMVRGELLPPDTDVEALTAETEAGAIAKQEQEREDAELAASRMQTDPAKQPPAARAA